MGGKAILLVVLGFSTIFLIFGSNFNNLTIRSHDALNDYYTQTIAHNTALSGVNLIANQIFLNPSNLAGFTDLSIEGGLATATIEATYGGGRIVTVRGLYEDQESIVQVVLNTSRFSRFAYFSMNETTPSGSNIWFADGDVITGPIHTQDYLRVNGSPIFLGGASSYKGIEYAHTTGHYEWVENGGHWENQVVGYHYEYIHGRYKKVYDYDYVWEIDYKKEYVVDSHSDTPQFNGGFSIDSIAMPTYGIDTVKLAAQTDGMVISDQDTVYMEFKDDSLSIKYGYSEPETTVYLPSFTNNGVIFVDDATVRMKGVLDGKVTVAVSGSGTPGNVGTNGRVFLDNDIVYKDDPLTNPNSNDYLGIVVQNDIYIKDNEPNRNNINIHASLYCQNGGFGAENYNTGSLRGTINLLGGVTQYFRRPVGLIGSTGYIKNYLYDERLLIASPPEYPGTGSFRIVTWFEESLPKSD